MEERDSISDLITGYKLITERQDRIDLAESMYTGSGEEVFANPRIQRLLNSLNVSGIEGFAYAAVPVDAVAGTLKLLPPVVIDATSGKPHDVGQKALDDLWRRNQLGPELRSLLHRVCLHGDAYLHVWPVYDDDIEPGMEDDEAPAGRAASTVDIIVNGAKTTLAVYDAEAPLSIAYVIRTWVERGTTRANLHYSDHVEKWRLTDGEADPDKPESWEPVPGADDIPTADGEISFHHFRNDRPYGRPEHERAYGPQRVISKLWASLAAVIDYLIAPTRYYLADPKMDDPHQSILSADYPEVDDDPQDPQESALRSDPNAVWKLYGSGAGQFEPANPDNLLRPLERAIQAASELTEIPRHRFGWPGAEPPSGAAVRALDRALLDKGQARRESLGPTLEAALEHALSLMGIDDVRVSVRWAPASQVTDLEGWQIIAAKIASGVPVRTCLVEAGYLPEQVDAWLATGAGTDLVRRLALLQALVTVAAIPSADKPAAPPVVPQLPDGPPADQGQDGPPDGAGPDAGPAVPAPPPAMQPGSVPILPAEVIRKLIEKIMEGIDGIEEDSA